MNILGIDPGSRITGFGLIKADKLKFTYVNSGCIRTQGDLNERIVTIYSGIKEILSYIQNYAAQKNIVRIQILTKLKNLPKINIVVN